MFNEAFGWLWVVAGFLAGAALGIGFERETFLGGYSSWVRRLLRLGHIAMVALGALNILAAGSLERAAMGDGARAIASWSIIAGAVLMPACCALAAWRPRAKPVFALAIVALMTGSSLIVAGLVCALIEGGAQ